jgi:hypothetical protein
MSATATHTIDDATAAIRRTLNRFIPLSELSAITEAMRGEEGEFFIDKVIDLAARLESMPKTFEQLGLGKEAVAHLHYFRGSCDWYITEKDSETEQLQAFGTADLGYGPEFGYISIQELIENEVELDLYFQPKPLKEIASTSHLE